MTVLSYPTAQPLNWDAIAKDPNRVTKMVQWSKRTISGRVVRGSLFFIAALDTMDRKAKARFGSGVDVIQPAYNTGVEASAGTHDWDNCIDWRILGVSALDAQRFARFECGMANWARFPWQGFSEHQHGFFLPPGGKVFPFKVGKYIDGGRSLGLSGYSSQLTDYWNEAYGLKNMHEQSSDPTPFPTDAAKMAGIFNLDRYIQKQREENMEYKDWSKESKQELVSDIAGAVAKRVLDVETVVLRGPKENKPIPIRSAVQRLLNGTNPRD